MAEAYYDFAAARTMPRRRLYRRDAGEDRDLAFGSAQRDVLEIILARTADLNVFLGHEVRGVVQRTFALLRISAFLFDLI